MLDGKYEDGPVPADTIDTWLPLSEEPKRNGWYDVKVRYRDMKTQKPVEMLALALFRNGKWCGDYRGKLLAWTEPMRYADDLEWMRPKRPRNQWRIF